MSLNVSPTSATIEAAFADCPEIFLEEVRISMVEASMYAEREIRERTPSSGAATLRESIGAMPVEITANAVRGRVVTSLAYAAPVEDGTKPHWAPIEPLIDWVERKLNKRGDEAQEVAQAIRFKIAAHGTEGAHMFRDGLAAVEPHLVPIFEAGAGRAIQRMKDKA